MQHSTNLDNYINTQTAPLALNGKLITVGSYGRGEPFNDVDLQVTMPKNEASLKLIWRLVSGIIKLSPKLRFGGFVAGAKNMDRYRRMKQLEKMSADNMSRGELAEYAELRQSVPFRSSMLSYFKWLISQQGQQDILFENGIKLDFTLDLPFRLPNGLNYVPVSVNYFFDRPPKREIINSLRKSFLFNLHVKRDFIKALKRLHSIAILEGDKKTLALTKPYIMSAGRSQRMALNVLRELGY